MLAFLYVRVRHFPAAKTKKINQGFAMNTADKRFHLWQELLPIDCGLVVRTTIQNQETVPLNASYEPEIKENGQGEVRELKHNLTVNVDLRRRQCKAMNVLYVGQNIKSKTV